MPADLTRPLLRTATPTDDAGPVAPGASIELVFSEAMKPGSGRIFVTNGATQTYLGRDGLLHTRIVNATDTRAIDIADTSQVTIAGDRVTIKPTAALLGATGYSVVMESGVLQDLAGNAYAGLADGNRLNFTTAADAPADTAKPTVVSLALDDAHLETGEHALLTVTMSEPVTGITSADFTVQGGRIEGTPTSRDGITWTVELVPDENATGMGTATFHPANAVDAAGNHAPDLSVSVDFSIDTSASLSFSLWNDSGFDSADFVTNTGSDQGLDIFCALVLDEGDRVQVAVDGETFTDAERGEGVNHWFAGGLQLPGDAGTIVVRVVDATGTVRVSVSQQYVIDATAPGPSARDAMIALDAASDSGSSGDGITNAAQPWVVVTLAGTTGYRPGDVIEVQEDGFEGPSAGRTVLQASDFDADGNLLAREVRVQLTGDMLHGAEGAHRFFVRLTDLAGNHVDGDYSEQMLEFAIDTSAPELIDTDPDEGGTVDGTQPSITLTFDEDVVLDAAATLILLSDSGDVQELGRDGAALDWDAEANVLTLALQHALHAGTQYRLVTSSAIGDAAGNVGWAADAVLLRFDTVVDGGEVIVVPVMPELSLHEDTASASDPEGGAHDGITSNPRIDVAGLQPGGSWEYSVDAGESWHTGSGDHFMLDAVSMTYEAGRIRVRQYGSGDEGQASEAGTLGEVTVDVDAPRTVIDYGSFHFVSGGTGTVTGMLVGEPGEGDAVEFTVDHGATWQRAGLDGYVYLHDVEVGYGGTIGLRVTDEAGNLGEAFLGASTVYVADGYGGTFDVGDGEALYAQGGDDRIVIGGTGFGYIDGGDGSDTLDVAFPEFNLADAAGKLDRMEVIDLGQAEGTVHTLHVSADAVRAIADGSTLTIDGDAFDTVMFDDYGWTWEHNDGTYVTWTNGDAVLLIGSAIDVRGGLEV